MARPATKKPAAAPARENRIVRYFKEVRGEVRKITWPSRKEALTLTMVVLAVTAAATAFMAIVDWAFTQLFTLIVG